MVHESPVAAVHTWGIDGKVKKTGWMLCLMLGMILPGASAFAQEEASTPAEATETSQSPNLVSQVLNSALGVANQNLEKVLFFSVTGDLIQIEKVDREGNPVIDPATGETEMTTVAVPFIVMVLVFGAIFFTFWYRWINIRGFRHSIDIIRGHYDDEKDQGEISHFRALTSALSATVGLGNIAGVAIAIQLGGPGAVFWMMLTAVFGMSSKFSSCTLAQLYRQYNPDGTISGGPMYYLDLGLRQKGAWGAVVGKTLAVMYAFMVMGGAIGGGNMFQANQAFEAVMNTFPAVTPHHNWIFGLVFAALVGMVTLGGIKRIGAATSRIVPGMCGLYVIASLYIIITNYHEVPHTLALIFKMAFAENAFYGGIVGVLVWGVTRAAFSNEAGLGSAAIAHAAAKTDEPVREGLVAMIGPFIDTIIICLMTALVVIITGAWADPDIPQKAGVTLTTKAFGSVFWWFEYILAICILLFAYSTMISWCYYGERGWIYLMDHFGGAGLKTVMVFRLAFVTFVFIGAVTKLDQVLGFSDMMILCMAFPNITGSILLAPEVLKVVKDYWGRYQSGQMERDR